MFKIWKPFPENSNRQQITNSHLHMVRTKLDYCIATPHICQFLVSCCVIWWPPKVIMYLFFVYVCCLDCCPKQWDGFALHTHHPVCLLSHLHPTTPCTLSIECQLIVVLFSKRVVNESQCTLNLLVFSAVVLGSKNNESTHGVVKANGMCLAWTQESRGAVP
jgi:hypothetical protein